MTITKEQLIQFITEKIPNDSIFEIEVKMEKPSCNNALIDTTFGSATHIIRNSLKQYRGEINLSYRYSQ